MRRSGVLKLHGKGICQLASLRLSTALWVLVYPFFINSVPNSVPMGVGLSNLLCYNSK
jgi:hypothetical protein